MGVYFADTGIMAVVDSILHARVWQEAVGNLSALELRRKVRFFYCSLGKAVGPDFGGPGASEHNVTLDGCPPCLSSCSGPWGCRSFFVLHRPGREVEYLMVCSRS